METLSVTIQVPWSRIDDLLCSAFENGSRYWAVCTSSKDPPAEQHRAKVEYNYQKCMYPGGYCMLRDIEAEKTYRLDYTVLLRGLSTFAQKEPKHFADFMSENDDAVTGDVFLQCCLFGEVVYG